MRIGFTYERKEWYVANAMAGDTSTRTREPVLMPAQISHANGASGSGPLNWPHGARAGRFVPAEPLPTSAPAPADADSELLSAEEEAEIVDALTEAGHSIIRIGDAGRLLSRLHHWAKECDLVFNRSVGYCGSERKSKVPCLLEAAGIPYTGSSPYVLSLTRNKLHTKLVVRAAGVPTPPAVLVDEHNMSTIEDALEANGVTYPAIVKPVAESSSIGIERNRALAHTPCAAAQRAIELLELYHQPALIETFIAGAEVEVPVLVDPQPRMFGVACIGLCNGKYDGDFFLSSDAIYDDQYDYVPMFPFVDRQRLAEMAERSARALGIRDYGRIDFRVAPDGTPWFIEASTHPHVQRHSGFNEVARQHGMSYAQMLDMLIQIAARRNGLIKLGL